MPISSVSPAKPSKRTKLERETTLVFNEQEPLATLWTASLKEVKKWAKLDLAIEPYGGGWRTHVSKQRIRISRPRTISPQNLQAIRERLADARSFRRPTTTVADSQTTTNTSAGAI